MRVPTASSELLPAVTGGHSTHQPGDDAAFLGPTRGLGLHAGGVIRQPPSDRGHLRHGQATAAGPTDRRDSTRRYARAAGRPRAEDDGHGKTRFSASTQPAYPLAAGARIIGRPSGTPTTNPADDMPPGTTGAVTSGRRSGRRGHRRRRRRHRLHDRARPLEAVPTRTARLTARPPITWYTPTRLRLGVRAADDPRPHRRRPGPRTWPYRLPHRPLPIGDSGSR